MSVPNRASRRRQGVVAALAAIFVSACAVGPDFKVPAAPDATGYTKGPLPARTASADTALGEAQRFQKEKVARLAAASPMPPLSRPYLHQPYA